MKFIKMFSHNLFTISVLLVGILILIGVFVGIVTALAEINFTTDNLNWGAGSVNSGSPSATLDSEAGTVTGGSWTASSGELILENIGTENLTLDLHSNKNADTLVGGSSSINSFQWKITEVESGSCVNITDTNWTDVNTTNPGTRICDLFYVDDTKDIIKIDFKIIIPSDTTKEDAQSATITVTVTAV